MTDSAGTGQTDQPRQRRILVEDILDGLVARASRALPGSAGSTDTSELTTQAQQVVDLAQQLKAAVSRLRQLDPTVLSETR